MSKPQAGPARKPAAAASALVETGAVPAELPTQEASAGKAGPAGKTAKKAVTTKTGKTTNTGKATKTGKATNTAKATKASKPRQAAKPSSDPQPRPVDSSPVDSGPVDSGPVDAAKQARSGAEVPTAREPAQAAQAPLSAPAPAAATSPGSSGRWSERDKDREKELLALLATLPADDPARLAARDELVTMHMPLAAFLARRFRDRGEHLDDLTQVATLGLIKAVDRFESGRGVEFSTFATPTMVGEIKRHFRDKGWAIRVPRRLQELRMAITKATAELSQSTGRSPTISELAAHLKISEEEAIEGLESAQAYATISLDSTVGGGDDEGSSIAETLGHDDASLVEVDNRASLHPLLAQLGKREQHIIYARFYENKTQAQIAQEVGISQMHVSRLLAKSLGQLREGLVEA